MKFSQFPQKSTASNNDQLAGLSGGQNALFPVSVIKETAVAGVKDLIVTSQTDADDKIPSASLVHAVGAEVDELISKTTDIDYVINTMTDQESVSVSGNAVTIKDSDGGIPETTLNIKPHQNGSGDPSPDNIRPITGYTAVDMTRTGKNLIGIKREGWSAQGNITKVLNAVRSELIRVAPGMQMFFSKKTAYSSSGFNMIARTFDADKNFIGSQKALGYGNTKSTWTVPDGIGYIGIVQFIDQSLTDAEIDGHELMASFIDDQYEPYQAQTYPITFPAEAGTVYGGTLDVSTGVLKVDTTAYNMGSLGWSYLDGGGFYTPTALSVKNVKNALCSAYKFNPLANDTTGSAIYNKLSNNQFAWYSNIPRVFVRDDRYTSVEDFKAAINGVQLICPLETPVEYTLTPAEVELLTGSNTLWMDADGTINMNYKTDAVAKFSDVNDIKKLLAALTKRVEALENA